MLFLIPSRFRHIVLVAAGVVLLAFGLIAATKVVALLGGVLVVWGLVRTNSVLRAGRRTTDIGSRTDR
ncbi:MAG: hypothetical protein JOZ07_18160 [Solirubrobacterales bacterium]|nr:hypothetical protein [Solirubrobacterales bacterium]